MDDPVVPDLIATQIINALKVARIEVLQHAFIISKYFRSMN